MWGRSQASAFDGCERRHGVRRCAFLFEYLGEAESDVFFHCDQIIRGLYEPFVRDWVGAFGNRSLAIRAEDLLVTPHPHSKSNNPDLQPNPNPNPKS